MKTIKNTKHFTDNLPLLSTIALSIGIIFLSVTSENKPTKRMRESGEILESFSKIEGKIPKQLFKETEGIIIIPEMLNVGLLLGGSRGKGIALVKMENGKWSDPAFITITGGSIGFQIGLQSVDLVLVFKHRTTLSTIKNGSFKLGGEVAVTAGPLGRDATASTDYKLTDEIYSYSRSKGLFAGITLNGEVLDMDKKSNAEFYKTDFSTNEIFSSSSSNLKSVLSLKRKLEKMQ